jgi:hypothetical protein
MGFDKSKLSRVQQGGLATFCLFALVALLDIASFPPANPEDLDEYAWRVDEQRKR